MLCYKSIFKLLVLFSETFKKRFLTLKDNIRCHRFKIYRLFLHALWLISKLEPFFCSTYVNIHHMLCYGYVMLTGASYRYSISTYRSAYDINKLRHIDKSSAVLHGKQNRLVVFSITKR